MFQERVRTNLDGMNALMRCRTLPELLAAQSTLFRENLELTLANSRRIAEVSARMVDNAPRNAAAPSQSTRDRAA
jgi:hypothetical protein